MNRFLPELPIGIIHRVRLTDRLLENKQKVLTIINSPAGYGKTILLVDYLNQYISNFAWIQCSRQISTLSDFCFIILRSLRNLNDSFGKNFEELLIASQNTRILSVKDIASVFINDFSLQFNDETILVFDDFHFAGNSIEQSNEFIDIVIESNLPNLKFLISSRGEPKLKLAKLKAKRNLFIIEKEDLQFNPEETHQLLESVYYIKCSKQQSAALSEKLDGWITALHLVMLSEGENAIINQNNSVNIEKSSGLYDYFAEDVIDSLDADVVLFLFQTSLLEQFQPEITNLIFRRDNSVVIINNLISKNLFLETVQFGNGLHYVYQKLFKDFLLNKLFSIINQNDLNEYYNDIALYFETVNETLQAVKYYVKASNSGKAISLIKEKYDNLKSKGKLIEVSEAVCSIKNIEKVTDTEILFIEADIETSFNKWGDDFNQRIDFLLETFKTAKDIKCYTKSVFLKAEYLISVNKVENGIEILENLSLTENDYINLSLKYLMLGRAFYRKGAKYLSRVLEYFEHFTKLPQDNIPVTLRGQAYTIAANVYADQTKYQKAVQMYLKSIQVSQDLFDNYKNLTNLICLNCYFSNYEDASKQLLTAKKLSCDFPIEQFRRFFLRSSIQFRYESGDYEEALVLIEKFVLLDSVKSNQVLLFSFSLMKVFTLNYLRMFNEASQELEFTFEIFKLEEPYFKCLCDDISAMLLLNTLNTNIPESAFESSIEFYRSAGLLHDICVAEFQFAKLDLINAEYILTKKHLVESLDILNENKITSFLEMELLLSRKIFDFAISEAVHKPFLKQIFSNVFEKVNYPWYSEAAKKRLAIEIEKLTDLRLLSFGTMDFYLRGDLIHEDKWIRKKSKIILAYLLTHPAEIISKDMVIDLFFDDIPPDKVDVVYHSTIYNIRTALKIYDLKSDAPKRSKQKPFDYNPQYLMYEDKTLRLNHDFYYKSDNVEFEELYSKFKVPGLSADDKIKFAEEAVRLYKGDFLPGYYDNWCEEMRINYKNIYIILCEGLVKEFELIKNYDKVIEYALLILNQDKLNENAYISIISAYTNQNNINMAKSRLASMLNIFEEELGEKPSAKTLQKIKTILDI